MIPNTLCKLLVLCSLFAGTATYSTAGEIWRWRDKENIVHFTDNRLTIPQIYRETARSRSFSDTEVITQGGAVPRGMAPAMKPKKGGEASQFTLLLDELSSHLRGEVERDSKIITWVNNGIAVKKMKEVFTRDLQAKNTLLKRIIKEDNEDLQSVQEWLADNISAENRILDSAPDPNPGTLYLFTQIKQSIKKNLDGKKDFLLTLDM